MNEQEQIQNCLDAIAYYRAEIAQLEQSQSQEDKARAASYEGLINAYRNILWHLRPNVRYEFDGDR